MYFDMYFSTYITTYYITTLLIRIPYLHYLTSY